MRRRTILPWRPLLPGFVLILLFPACEGSQGTVETTGSGGAPARTGGSSSGGQRATGGTVASGGAVSTGGTRATGGVSANGGQSTGGTTTGSTGGTLSTGGSLGPDAGRSRRDAGADTGGRDARDREVGPEVQGPLLDARRDTAPEAGRDTALAPDTKPAGVLDPVTGLANCPVNSGTTPLPAPGAITWTLAKAASPTAAEQDAYNRIIPAMNTAVCLYSAYTSLKKQINVSYNAGVPTAEGSTNGAGATSDIRFGSTASMNYITAMHEMSHNFGIGSTAFNNLCVNGVFGGANATAELRAITGVSTDAVKCGGSHFWPYGLNYTTEWKDDTEGKNHCRMVLAIRKDLGL